MNLLYFAALITLVLIIFFLATVVYQIQNKTITKLEAEKAAQQKEIDDLRTHTHQLEQANPLRVHFSTIARMDNIAGEIAAMRTYREQARRLFDMEDQMLDTITNELKEMRQPNAKKNSKTT